MKLLLSIIASGFMTFSACATIDVSLQMQLGNPTGAISDTNNHDHYLIQRSGEAIDYSDHWGEPNWAAWDLTAGDVGDADRSDKFFTDTNLPSNFYHVKTADYNGVGNINFNRGHLCPSEDRTDSRQDNDAVFFMSNIMPQSAQNNQGVWANFEGYCRSLANSGNELLIMCGPSGFGTNTIPSGIACIASNTWKIVVIVPLGGGTALSRLTATNRVISLSIPNVTNGLSSAWQNYVTSARQIELDTGFTFFTATPDLIASVYRAKIDGPPAPTIANFSPPQGVTGESITVNGVNLSTASEVLFNGANANFIVNSASQITATIPSGATTGEISIITAGGLATSANDFIVTSMPTLNIVSGATDSFVISWPAPSNGFILQQNPDLGTGNWMNVTSTVTASNGWNQIVMPASPGNSFFRLIR